MLLLNGVKACYCFAITLEKRKTMFLHIFLPWKLARRLGIDGSS